MTTMEQRINSLVGLLSNKLKLPDGSSAANDVTQPGNPESRAQELHAAEQLGQAPLLFNPLLNRGTNFSYEERQEKGLEGLLPPAVESLELQGERVMLQLKEDAETDLERYEVLSALAAADVTLFYHVIINNIVKLAPIIYTPTVGEACQKYDRIYQNNALGMWFDSFHSRGRFRAMLDNFYSHNVQIIVVTDGGRILGLGDLGANGMGIPVGKIALYVAGGGFHPEHSLPALIDVGTDNEDLLKDKFYLGNKEHRIKGEEHMKIIEEFCYAVKDKYPHALIQFEDFNTEDAFEILERMRDKVLCFNDDIQGTGAVVTAGVINGLKAQHVPLDQARILFYGAGSSAVGVANTIVRLLQKEGGLSEVKAKQAVWLCDSKGLITKKREGFDELPSHKKLLAREDDPPMKDLKDIIAHVKPHALIGLAGVGHVWNKEDIEELCKHCKRPLIFPLSNPTDKAEITAQEAVDWSHGKCIFAAGSPFDPVEYEGRKIPVGQANNVFIFPGTGFGAVMAKATKVSDDMFIAAARGLADYVPQDCIDAGILYPEIAELRAVSARVAATVAKEAEAEGLARTSTPKEGWQEFIEHRMWDPSKTYLDPSNDK